MNIYFENCKREKISEKELHYLALSIKRFVATYLKHIYVKDMNHMEILRRLDYIATLILSKQYYELFESPNDLEYDLNGEIDDDLPWRE